MAFDLALTHQIHLINRHLLNSDTINSYKHDIRNKTYQERIIKT